MVGFEYDSMPGSSTGDLFTILNYDPLENPLPDSFIDGANEQEETQQSTQQQPAPQPGFNIAGFNLYAVLVLIAGVILIFNWK